MKPTIVYCYPLNGQGGIITKAARFVESYHTCPPGRDHDTLIICNGAPVTSEAQLLFGSMPGLKFLEHDNSGYDIGAFQRAAREVPAELMIFFGTTSYFRIPNWARRVCDSVDRYGDTLYGAMGNAGDSRVSVAPHIRTTGFWITPKLLNQYVGVVTRPEQRYGFEHGEHCLTSWCYKRGLRVLVVTAFGEFERGDWDGHAEGFHRGTQAALLFGDRLTEPPYYPNA